MNIDKRKVHAKIRRVIDAQKVIKAGNKKYRTDYKFTALSYEMTILCSLLAQARGKIPIKKLTKQFGFYAVREPIECFTLEHQEKILGRSWAKKTVDECLVEEEEQIDA